MKKQENRVKIAENPFKNLGNVRNSRNAVLNLSRTRS
jgi:hypothetical protein